MSPITFTVILSIQSEKIQKLEKLLARLISYNVKSSDIPNLNGQ